MQIRPLEAALVEDVVDLWEQVELTRPWNDPRADLQRAVEGPSSVVLVGTDRDRLIATVMVGHDGHRGWVYYLGVHPDAQGNGHGREMMRAAEAWLRERAIPKLNLRVRTSNGSATGFYAALGYSSDEVQVFSRRLDALREDDPPAWIDPLGDRRL